MNPDMPRLLRRFVIMSFIKLFSLQTIYISVYHICGKYGRIDYKKAFPLGGRWREAPDEGRTCCDNPWTGCGGNVSGASRTPPPTPVGAHSICARRFSLAATLHGRSRAPPLQRDFYRKGIFLCSYATYKSPQVRFLHRWRG